MIRLQSGLEIIEIFFYSLRPVGYPIPLANSGSPKFCALWSSPVPVAMISSLPVRSHRVLTCRGSGASTTRST